MKTPDKLAKDQGSAQASILEAAEAVFCRKGYAGTRISEIAERAQANQALVHYYFENKEKLYQAVLAPLVEQWKAHVLHTQWIGDNPEQILRRFIATHCEYHFRYPSLYKLAKWEELEGKDLFATPFFEQDVAEKIAALLDWQKSGLISGAINAHALLYLIWNMIQKFFDKDGAELAKLLKSDGGARELRREVAEQIAELVLHGVLGRTEGGDAGGGAGAESEAGVPVRVWLSPGMPPEALAEARAIRGRLAQYANLRLTEAEGSPFAWDAANRPRGYALIAFTAHGEMPDGLRELIAAWTGDPSAIAGACGAVWVIGESPAARALQAIVETHVNRLGGYALPRTDGQTVPEYVRRFHKLVSAMA